MTDTRSPLHVSSRANAWVKDLRRLAHGGPSREDARVWIEGEHLCSAALAKGVRPQAAVFSESAWPQWAHAWGECARRTVVLEDGLMASVSGLESPAALGFVLEPPTVPTIAPQAATVVLDRVQDAGNVGSILRSAAAFGFEQILALRGTARLWSPKVVRAGMGAHFGLALVEGLNPDDLMVLQAPLLATSSHQGDYLHAARLPWPCAWIMGHEGQGVAPELAARAAEHVRIAQPGGQESLGVAAAAAICLHASAAVRVVARAPAHA